MPRISLLILLTLMLGGCDERELEFWAIGALRGLGLLAFAGLFLYIRSRRLGHNEGKGGRDFPDYDDRDED